MLESFVVDKIVTHNDDSQMRPSRARQLILHVINFIVSLMAAYIAWECNSGMNMGSRIVISFIAFIFPVLYLFYFFVVHTVLKYPC